MVDMSALAHALMSFKTAKDIAEAMIGLRDGAAFQAKMIEFQSAILDAQSAAFAANEERATLIEKIADLEKQVTKLEAWETQKQRYEMRALCRDGAAIAYALKSDASGSEPFHCICATCYDNGKRSILQFLRVVLMGAREQVLICPVCKTEVHSDNWPPATR